MTMFDEALALGVAKGFARRIMAAKAVNPINARIENCERWCLNLIGPRTFI